MNHEMELKLQAQLDGELSAAEAAEVDRLLQQDPAARALAAELKSTQAILLGNEIPRALPESPDFFWSKVQREIQRLEPAPARQRPPWLTWTFRLLAPAGLAALLAFMVWSPFSGGVQLAKMPAHAEIENPLDDASSITFRSETEGVTVFWVSTR